MLTHYLFKFRLLNDLVSIVLSQTSKVNEWTTDKVEETIISDKINFLCQLSPFLRRWKVFVVKISFPFVSTCEHFSLRKKRQKKPTSRYVFIAAELELIIQYCWNKHLKWTILYTVNRIKLSFSFLLFIKLNYLKTHFPKQYTVQKNSDSNMLLYSSLCAEKRKGMPLTPWQCQSTHRNPHSKKICMHCETLL